MFSLFFLSAFFYSLVPFSVFISLLIFIFVFLLFVFSHFSLATYGYVNSRQVKGHFASTWGYFNWVFWLLKIMIIILRICKSYMFFGGSISCNRCETYLATYGVINIDILNVFVSNWIRGSKTTVETFASLRKHLPASLIILWTCKAWYYVSCRYSFNLRTKGIQCSFTFISTSSCKLSAMCSTNLQVMLDHSPWHNYLDYVWYVTLDGIIMEWLTMYTR